MLFFDFNKTAQILQVNFETLINLLRLKITLCLYVFLVKVAVVRDIPHRAPARVYFWRQCAAGLHARRTPNVLHAPEASVRALPHTVRHSANARSPRARVVYSAISAGKIAQSRRDCVNFVCLEGKVLRDGNVYQKALPNCRDFIACITKVSFIFILVSQVILLLFNVIFLTNLIYSINWTRQFLIKWIRARNRCEILIDND